MTSPTFHCPFCGAPISGSMPGQTFACMYCKAKVVAPSAGMIGPQSARAWKVGANAAASDSPFASGIDDVAVTFDPQLGLVAVGAHAPHGEPARLRAWDAKSGRVLWESQQGQAWVDRVDGEAIAIAARSVYVANRRQLLCLDLMNGTQRWTATLSDAPASSGGRLAIADPFPAGQRGAILVPTIDNALFAFDRDSGQPLWNRAFGEKSIEVTPVPDLCTCLVRYGHPYIKVDVINPAYPRPIASLGHDHWSSDLGLARLSGRTVLTVADDLGREGDDDGLFCFDAVTGAPHFFDRVDDLDEDDIVPCVMGARAFAATSGGEALYVGPAGRAIPVPLPNHAIAAMCPAGPTLALLLRKSHGTPVRRIIGLDPHSLAFRFDAGEAGSEPDDDWDRHMVSDGHSIVFVATPSDDADDCELRSIDTSTGRMRWSKKIGAWRDHRFIGGQLLVVSEGSITALAPANGETLASLRT